MPINPKTIHTALKIAVDILKTILNTTATLSSNGKKGEVNAESKPETRKP